MNSQTISIGGITDNSKKQKSILDKMCYEMYIFTGHRANLLPWSEPLDFQDKLQTESILIEPKAYIASTSTKIP